MCRPHVGENPSPANGGLEVFSNQMSYTPSSIKDIESLSTKIQDLVDMLRTDRHSRLGITEVAAVTEVLIATSHRYFSSLDTALYKEFNPHFPDELVNRCPEMEIML